MSTAELGLRPGRVPAAATVGTVGVVIAAEVRLHREGLALALRDREGLQVLGTAAAGEQVLALVEELRPDVLLLDVGTPAALETLRASVERLPQTRVLALSIDEDGRDVVACAEAGAAGYVPRDASLEDLVAAVRRAVRGEVLCPPRITAQLFRRVRMLAAAGPGSGAAPRVQQGTLSSREVEIVRLLERGLSNKQIARQLYIEVSTVKTHIHNILDKLNVARREQVAAWARGRVLDRLR